MLRCSPSSIQTPTDHCHLPHSRSFKEEYKKQDKARVIFFSIHAPSFGQSLILWAGGGSWVSGRASIYHWWAYLTPSRTAKYIWPHNSLKQPAPQCAYTSDTQSLHVFVLNLLPGNFIDGTQILPYKEYLTIVLHSSSTKHSNHFIDFYRMSAQLSLFPS